MLYWLSKSTKRTLAEMSVGVILFNLLLGMAAALILPGTSYPVMPVIKGLCVGMAAAILMLIHMADTIERSLQSGDPDYARKTTIAQSMLRKGVFIAAIFLCWYFLRADLLAIVIGTMGMKAGAYLQPLIHRISGGQDNACAGPQEGIGPAGDLEPETASNEKLEERRT